MKSENRPVLRSSTAKGGNPKSEGTAPSRSADRHVRKFRGGDPRGHGCPRSYSDLTDHIYFDHYRQPQYYGAVKSTDLEHWRDVSSQVSFPKGSRHGTVLKVPQSVVLNLQNQ